LEFLDDLNRVVDIVDEIVSGKIEVLTYLPRPKRRKMAQIKAKLQEKSPVFTLCLLARCKKIHSCWDLKEYKFLGVKEIECPRMERIKRLSQEKYSYKSFRYGKTLVSFSKFELSLIIMCLRYYILHNEVRKNKVKEILKQLELCENAYLIGKLREV